MRNSGGPPLVQPDAMDGSENPRERGVALLIVLLVLLFTSILALELKHTAALHLRLATSKRDGFLMRHAMRGHLEILKQVLAFDATENQIESQADRWTDEKYTALQSLPDEEDADEDKEQSEPVSSKDFEIKARVEDEARKFNLANLLVEDDDLRAHWEQVFIRLLMIYREDFTQYTLSRATAEELLRNLRDWIGRPDEDRAPHPNVADGQSSIVTPDELLMVKGFTREIFFDLPPEDEGDESPPGLCRYLTVWSAGPINLNTAERPVLHALFQDGDRDLADTFLSWRDEEAEEQPDGYDEDDPLTNTITGPADLSKVPDFTPEKIQDNRLNGSTVTATSRVFSILLEGEAESGYRRQERWVLERLGSQGFRTILCEERNDPVYEDQEEQE